MSEIADVIWGKPGDGGTVYGSAWVTCRCGKERNVGYRDVPSLVVKRLQLAAISLCRRCSADLSVTMDSCPETVLIPDGVSGCSRPRNHAGRCERHPPVPAEIRQLAMENPGVPIPHYYVRSGSGGPPVERGDRP